MYTLFRRDETKSKLEPKEKWNQVINGHKIDKWFVIYHNRNNKKITNERRKAKQKKSKQIVKQSEYNGTVNKINEYEVGDVQH